MKRSTTSRLPLMFSVAALMIAVFGSTPLGHAAYKAFLPANSVGTFQLKSDAVTSAKVKNGSLLRTDFAQGQIPQGPAGEKGEKGDAGTSKVTVVRTTVNAPQLSPTNKPQHQLVSGVAKCPAGQRATGGGVAQDGNSTAPEPLATNTLTLIESVPLNDNNHDAATDDTPTGWYAEADRNEPALTGGFVTATALATKMYVYALCTAP